MRTCLGHDEHLAQRPRTAEWWGSIVKSCARRGATRTEWANAASGTSMIVAAAGAHEVGVAVLAEVVEGRRRRRSGRARRRRSSSSRCSTRYTVDGAIPGSAAFDLGDQVVRGEMTVGLGEDRDEQPCRPVNRPPALRIEPVDRVLVDAGRGRLGPAVPRASGSARRGPDRSDGGDSVAALDEADGAAAPAAPGDDEHDREQRGADQHDARARTGRRRGS